MIFYSLSRTGGPNPKTLVRGFATTDTEYDILYTLPNPDRPSVFIPEPYHSDIPEALLITEAVEENLCDDLRQLGRARFNRNFNPATYTQLVERIRFRFPLCANLLLQHTARQSLRSCSLAFFKELGLASRYKRGDPVSVEEIGYNPETGEII